MDAHKIPMSLRNAYLSMHRQTNAHLKRYGITADQFVCLFLLSEQDAIIQKELVKRANSDPNTIRAMLVILEKKGLIIRETDSEDRRARIVKITAKGQKIFNQCVDALAPVRKLLTDHLNEERANLLNTLLKEVSLEMS